MQVAEFVKVRQKSKPFVSDCRKHGSSVIQPAQDVNVPFIVDGSPMEVSKKVPYEPIKADYASFDNDFMINHGQTVPMRTFRNDVQNVLEKLTPEFIQKLQLN